MVRKSASLREDGFEPVFLRIIFPEQTLSWGGAESSRVACAKLLRLARGISDYALYQADGAEERVLFAIVLAVADVMQSVYRRGRTAKLWMMRVRPCRVSKYS